MSSAVHCKDENCTTYPLPEVQLFRDTTFRGIYSSEWLSIM